MIRLLVNSVAGTLSYSSNKTLHCASKNKPLSLKQHGFYPVHFKNGLIGRALVELSGQRDLTGLETRGGFTAILKPLCLSEIAHTFSATTKCK